MRSRQVSTSSRRETSPAATISALRATPANTTTAGAPMTDPNVCPPVVTLLSYMLDLTGRGHLMRALFRRRATQVVVSEPDPAQPRVPVRLVITASVDAPRTGALFRDGWARAEASARRALHGHLSSPPALLAALLFAIAALAVARLAGGDSQAL